VRGRLGGSSVKRLTLDLRSGLDLRVMSSSPVLCSRLGVEATLKNVKNEKAGGRSKCLALDM